jgi:hypothetical protein
MNDSFISVFSGFRAQLWVEGLAMPCSALNLGCGIAVNSERLAGTGKWEDILKLYEIDKQNVLYKVFWVFIRCGFLLRNQHFGTICLSHLQGHETLKMGQTSSPETWVSYKK